MYDLDVYNEHGIVSTRVGEVAVSTKDIALDEGQSFSFNIGAEYSNFITMATTTEQGDTSKMGSLKVSRGTATFTAKAKLVIFMGEY